jgi:hypothetical protein
LGFKIWQIWQGPNLQFGLLSTEFTDNSAKFGEKIRIRLGLTLARNFETLSAISKRANGFAGVS